MPRGRHARARTRQRRAFLAAAAVVAVLVTGALAAGAAELVAHGWVAFVFRGPGVGGTPGGP